MASQIHIVAEEALSLLDSLSKEAQVLTDPETVEFKESMKRWSDLDVQIPSAIFKPATESDVVQIVNHAVKSAIPIVCKAGGHSPWSTVNSKGWILDLSLLNRVTLHTTSALSETATATIQAGVLTKALNETVAKGGYFVQSAGASTVGHIPFLLGGGNSWLTGSHGVAVDNLVEARVVTATRGLVVVSETENRELFWAIKGAGWFFGVVTEVVVKIFPAAELDGGESVGGGKGLITAWTCVFLPKQIEQVAAALERLASEEDGVGGGKSPGMAAILAFPGQTTPVIVINTTHFRPEDEADRIVEPLLALNPIKQIKNKIGFANITDSAEALNKQGGLKTQISCGMRSFSAKKFEEALKFWTRAVEQNLSASESLFMFNWSSTKAMKRVPELGSAYSHRDVAVWSMSFIISPDEKAAKEATKNAEVFLAMCQEDQEEDEKAMFPNHTRVHSLEQRYRSEERRRKLRDLKLKWDPEGVFTRQFL